MSTKKILEALKRQQEDARAAHEWGTVNLVSAALAEVEAIEKAALVLESEGIGDFVYTVRDRAAEDRAFAGNTWEHPRVSAYGEAAQVISNIAKEANK